MQDFDESERALVALARRGFSPSADDAARVLARVEAALAAGPAHDTMHAGASEPGALAGSQALRWLRKVGLALSIAGASGSIAYRWGFEAGRSEARSSARVEAPAARAEEPADTAAGLAQLPPRALTPREHAVATPSARPRPGRPPPPAQGERPATSSVDSLQREVAALREIERALREGEPGTALERLDALDVELPAGRLLEERAAASSIARCALGLGKRRAILEEFSHAHPDSMYLERVQQGCANR